MAESRPPRKRRGSTATSSFGVSRRESHDSSSFYSRFEMPVASVDDHVVEPKARDELYCGDARDMSDVADGSVALVVTSPPYFAGKAYEEALGEGHIPASYLEYLEMLTDVFACCAAKLEPGGRIAVNVANLGRRPYRSLSADVITILQDRLGLWLRGEVIWQKARGAASSCAWGSYRQPSNPVLRDVTERVVIASKGRLDRARPPRQRALEGLPSAATITADEFMEATLDVWELPTESASRVGHPAPFPVELPRRVIELHTYEGDLVLDPFMGSGTTAIAAVETGRHYVGYDMDPDYVRLAEERVADRRAQLGGAAPDALPRDRVVDVARRLLADQGLNDIDDKVRPVNGVPLAFAARDPHGRRVLFDLAGGFTVGPRGLRRSELLWRTLGRAATLAASDPDAPLVVLTTELPPKSSANAKALRLAVGDTIAGVVDLSSPDAAAQLATALDLSSPEVRSEP